MTEFWNSHDRRRDDGLWVQSDRMPDGAYGVSVTVDADFGMTLNRDQAVAYAVACHQRAVEAEHDTAVLRLLTGKHNIDDETAAAAIVYDLRPDRPDGHTATEPLQYVVSIGRAKHPRPDAGAYIPVILMQLNGNTIGQLTPTELRDHAAGVLGCLAAADLDSALYRALVGKFNLEDEQARAVVDDLCNHWPRETEGSRR